jgi:hypothetical protein
MEKLKPTFKKEIVTKLTDAEQSMVLGGNQQALFTTSNERCTGILCCDPNPPTPITSVSCP